MKRKQNEVEDSYENLRKENIAASEKSKGRDSKMKNRTRKGGRKKKLHPKHGQLQIYFSTNINMEK